MGWREKSKLKECLYLISDEIGAFQNTGNILLNYQL